MYRRIEPQIICIGAVNTHLIKLGLRGYVSINVQTGDALDTHSFATLIGVGATTVNPYLAFDSLFERYSKKLFGNLSFDECVSRFIKSVNLGLLNLQSESWNSNRVHRIELGCCLILLSYSSS